MIGIVDCNNFYASCERVFNPGLRDRPVVVLSNNDGCIIARSNEAKALGLKMSQPFFEVRELIERHGVAVFSSNYSLYGDMSRRVMSILADMTPGIEQYSIDECFIDLDGIDDVTALGRRLVRAVGKGTGIPVTMGVGPSKTLAKMASHFGKRYKGYEGVCVIDSDAKRETALRLTPVGDVWGIGRKSAAKLTYHGVTTAWELALKSESWVRRQLTIAGVRTWRELHGQDCIDISELPRRQTICHSRSFAGQGLTALADMEEAVADFAASCARKLKEQHSVCRALTVYALTNRHRMDLVQHTVNHTVPFTVPTADTQEIVAAAVKTLRHAMLKGCAYKKAGIMVWDICSAAAVQTDLFDTVNRGRQARLAQAIDAINRRNGRNTVKVAVQGCGRPGHVTTEHISRHYTTDLRHIIRVKAT